MTSLEIGLLSFPVLMGLIFMRVPIGLAMFTVAVGGLYFVTDGMSVALSRLKHETFSTFSSYSLWAPVPGSGRSAGRRWPPPPR